LEFGTKGNRIYYLSTPPSQFPLIIKKLHQHNLIYDEHTYPNKFSRIVIEKPFGHDLSSALALESTLELYLHEDQMYRIDHYLGKETVQNLLVFRFANAICEPLWNNKYIDHVQITVSEEDGIGTRGKLYEEAGTLRDIVQNHMMQLVSLIAMEPPVSLNANSIRDEKVKILNSIRPMTEDQIKRYAVRGQYGPGFIKGEPVRGYTQEDNVSSTSYIDTYVGLELFIDTWRWTGVPFFLRTGKRLPKRATEIAILFKELPEILFSSIIPHQNNTLVIRIQPDEGISLKFNSKIPGSSTLVHPVKMDFRYSTHFGTTPPEAYERLLCDCMLGDQTLFARKDEVLASWKIIQPILECWQTTHPSTFPNYAAGTWGPAAADHMIQQEGRFWRQI
jgi:glucose-6-phosphate 1-dehydrogenase